MTQPEETTAALIARLHEELTIKEAQLANVRKSEAVHVDLAHKAYQERDRAKADLESSKAECLQWRKDIDIERAEVARLSRQLENTKGMLAERSGQSDGWFRACKQAEKELGEQLARAEKAEAELAHVRLMLQERTAMGDEYYAGKQRAENMLAERTREREEARAKYNAEFVAVRRELNEAREQLGRVQADYQVFMLGTAHGAKCWADECGWHCDEGCKAKYARKCVAAQELKDAREQLAKPEWIRLAGWNREPQCGLCQGFDPEHYSRKYDASLYGHRPTCWFAKQNAERKDLDPVAVAALHATETAYAKIRNHRKDCPARTADDVAWVDSQWQVGSCRTAPIEGPRPRPIGCEGCKCAAAEKGAAKPPTLREQWKTKQAQYDHWLDACGYLFNWHSDSKNKEERYPVPKRNGIGVVTVKVGKSARPEPRFKVGEKVFWRGKEVVITWAEWFPPVRVWCYGSTYSATPMPESELKPAPKFAVGDWIESKSVTGPVIARHWERSRATTWSYDVQATDMVRMLYEFELTAQTPQHKHDCKGSVFLGRYEGFDLWWRPTMREVVAVEPSVARCYAVNGDLYNPAAVEAWRRAVARGLV